VLNLLAFVIFASSLFMRAVDPVIPQIATGLNVEPATAALLSTGFTLPYALIQPVLGALADMLSKTRLMLACLGGLAVTSVLAGLSMNFEVLMVLRVVAGLAAGGTFPIALAIAGDRVPVRERQVAVGRLLFAAMSGNLLGASCAGFVGDLLGWRGVFIGGGIVGLVVLAAAIPGFRGLADPPGKFDLSTLGPNYRAIFSNPRAKFCFGAVAMEAIFLFGIFPYMATMLHAGGETRASIAGIVIAGFGIGGVIYTLCVSWLLSRIGEQKLMRAGGMVMAAGLIVIALRAPWPWEFVNFVVVGFGFYMLHGVVQIYVTELAPAARASATALHSFFFFIGQATGPVIYGAGFATVGPTPVLLIGAVVLTVTGWICAARLRHPGAVSDGA